MSGRTNRAFTYPVHSSCLSLLETSYEIACCSFSALSFSVFVEATSQTPSLWPLGPGALEGTAYIDGLYDTENMASWADSRYRDRLIDLLSWKTPVVYDSHAALIPAHKHTVFGRFLERQPWSHYDTLELMNFDNNSNMQIIKEAADQLGWCGSVLYHSGYWLILFRPELSNNLRHLLPAEDDGGFFSLAIPRTERDQVHLDFYA